MDDLAVLISDYPWMEAICMDMSEYLYHPEEVVTMFSEALRKLDENTVNYMIDELKKEIEKTLPISESMMKSELDRDFLIFILQSIYNST